MRLCLVLGLFSIISAILLSSCANVSRIERDSIIAYGELLGDASEPLYYSIGIDIDKSTDNSILNSRIKLANNAPNLSLAELNPDFVAIFLSPFTPPHQWPDSWKKKAKEDDSYSGGGFFSKFNKKGRLLFVGICSHCENQREYPIVITPDGKSHYTLPLTIKQFSDVFGLPTRKYKVNEIRY